MSNGGGLQEGPPRRHPAATLVGELLYNYIGDFHLHVGNSLASCIEFALEEHLCCTGRGAFT
jgi:hypothetical protein